MFCYSNIFLYFHAQEMIFNILFFLRTDSSKKNSKTLFFAFFKTFKLYRICLRSRFLLHLYLSLSNQFKEPVSWLTKGLIKNFIYFFFDRSIFSHLNCPIRPCLLYVFKIKLDLF